MSLQKVETLQFSIEHVEKYLWGSNKQIFNFFKIVRRESRNILKFGPESRNISNQGRTSEILNFQKLLVEKAEKVETYFGLEKKSKHNYAWSNN